MLAPYVRDPSKLTEFFFERPVIPQVMLHGCFNAELLYVLTCPYSISLLLHLNCSILAWQIISLLNNGRKKKFFRCSLFSFLLLLQLKNNFNLSLVSFGKLKEKKIGLTLITLRDNPEMNILVFFQKRFTVAFTLKSTTTSHIVYLHLL